MIGFIEYNNIGAIDNEASISVDANNAVAYTVPAGKKGVSIQNVGNKQCWYGGSSVDPATNKGNKMFQNQSLVYKNVKNTFKIYFLCAAGSSTTLGVVNHS